MRAIHVSVRVAPVRSALSHGDVWELCLLKFFIHSFILQGESRDWEGLDDGRVEGK